MLKALLGQQKLLLSHSYILKFLLNCLDVLKKIKLKITLFTCVLIILPLLAFKFLKKVMSTSFTLYEAAGWLFLLVIQSFVSEIAA